MPHARKRSLRITLTILVCLLAPFGGWHDTHAQSVPEPYLPAFVFPAHTTLKFAPSVTNEEMDRTWGTDGFGQPFMHDAKEADFQRLSGWMELASRRRGSSYMYFAIFVSSYGDLLGRPGNAAAFYDWQASVAGFWRLPLARSQPMGLLPQGVPGVAETRILRAKDGGPTVTIAGWWGSTQEVEALALFTPDVMSLTLAKRILANVVRAAVRLPVQGPA